MSRLQLVKGQIINPVTGQPIQLTKTKVILGLPVYKDTPAATLKDILHLMNSSLFESFIYSDCSLAVASRNNIVQQAYKNCPDFTHILFIDNDQCDFTADHVRQLLKMNVDIAAGVTVLRQPNEAGERIVTFIPIEQKQVHDFRENKICEVASTGFFFTLVRRRVFDNMREDTPRGPIWFTMDRWPRHTVKDEVAKLIEENKHPEGVPYTFGEVGEAIQKAFAYGMNIHRHTSLIGEDVEFCFRARAKGFRIYVNTDITLGHIGQEIYRP